MDSRLADGETAVLLCLAVPSTVSMLADLVLLFELFTFHSHEQQYGSDYLSLIDNLVI